MSDNILLAKIKELLDKTEIPTNGLFHLPLDRYHLDMYYGFEEIAPLEAELNEDAEARGLRIYIQADGPLLFLVWEHKRPEPPGGYLTADGSPSATNP